MREVSSFNGDIGGLLEEYADIVGSLKRRLTLTGSLGIKNIARVRPGLADVYKEAGSCSACTLGEGPEVERVTGCGPLDGDGDMDGAAIAFIHGRPFKGAGSSIYSGAEGELLARIIKSMNLNGGAVHLGFAVKCRGAEDVPVAPECVGLLSEELEAVNPALIVALGPTAAGVLFGSTEVGAMRGRLLELGSARGLATYSPAQMIEDPSLKKAVWADIKLCMEYLKERL